MRIEHLRTVEHVYGLLQSMYISARVDRWANGSLVTYGAVSKCSRKQYRPITYS